MHAGGLGATSVWWNWTAPATGIVSISTSGSEFDTLLAAYVGPSVQELTEVASNDDFDGEASRIAFVASANVTYRIAVDGLLGKAGRVQWQLIQTDSAVPANDSLADAQTLTGATVEVEAFNVGATDELNEPIHAQQPGGRSVWWNWTAPSTGVVNVSTIGSTFDTLLAVYQGDSIASLQEVANSDDFEGTQSLLPVSVTAGTTYRIAVDGFQGAEGSIALAIVPDRLAPNAAIIPVFPVPRVAAVDAIGILFDEVIQGFDVADLVLTRDGEAIDLINAGLVSDDNQIWALTNLARFATDRPGNYQLLLNAIDSGIEDLAGNDLAEEVVIGWNDIRQAGDANTDRQFDQLDLVAVLQGGRYLTNRQAAWGQGDWTGDGLFNQLDLVAALQAGNYLQGRYAT